MSVLMPQEPLDRMAADRKRELTSCLIMIACYFYFLCIFIIPHPEGTVNPLRGISREQSVNIW